MENYTHSKMEKEGKAYDVYVLKPDVFERMMNEICGYQVQHCQLKKEQYVKYVSDLNKHIVK